MSHIIKPLVFGIWNNHTNDMIVELVMILIFAVFEFD